MLRWLIWSVFVVSWTVALEVPVTKPETLPGGAFIMTNKYLLTKSLHIGAYALLAVLSAWVPVPLRYRWLMMFFLMAHAATTELLQELLYDYCFRGGSLADVAYDQLGILIGAIVSWKWWTRADPIDQPDAQARNV